MDEKLDVSFRSKSINGMHISGIKWTICSFYKAIQSVYLNSLIEWIRKKSVHSAKTWKNSQWNLLRVRFSNVKILKIVAFLPLILQFDPLSIFRHFSMFLTRILASVWNSNLVVWKSLSKLQVCRKFETKILPEEINEKQQWKMQPKFKQWGMQTKKSRSVGFVLACGEQRIIVCIYVHFFDK